jgi:hypothetical protein
MRFYAMTDQQKDRTGNLPAGTVVDSGVTDPFIFEFYRMSLPLLLRNGSADPQFKLIPVCKELPNLPTMLLSLTIIR